MLSFIIRSSCIKVVSLILGSPTYYRGYKLVKQLQLIVRSTNCLTGWMELTAIDQDDLVNKLTRLIKHLPHQQDTSLSWRELRDV